MLEIFKFNSINEGKNILITGAIHGNETCGTVACNNIIKKIKSGKINIKSGSITFIPISNPEAYKANKRFLDVNLNRVIIKHKSPKLYEEKIANIIANYIKASDYHLDLHSMPENGHPFAFEDHEEQAEFAKILGLKYIFVGWPNVYKDSKTIKDYSTQSYAHKVKTIGCTVECGSHMDTNSIKIAEDCILRSLGFLDIIDYDYTTLPQQTFIEMKKVFFKEHEGKLVKNYTELNKINKGDIIAIYDNGEKIIASNDCYIIFPDKNAKIGNEWFYIGNKK